jgi:hypothetical protein
MVSALPRVLDAWRGGCRRSWLFSKRKPTNELAWGRTIDLASGGDCALGVPEAVHAPIAGLELHVKLRVLTATSGPPPELSLYGLHENPLL